MRVRTANEFDPDFPVARDQQVRDPLQGVFADFKADLLVSQICFDPKPLIFQEFSGLPHVFGLLLGDIHDDRLHRREPGGQPAGVVLDQDAEKTLQRAEDRPVQHDRRVLLAVLVDVMSPPGCRAG